MKSRLIIFGVMLTFVFLCGCSDSPETARPKSNVAPSWKPKLSGDAWRVTATARTHPPKLYPASGEINYNIGSTVYFVLVQKDKSKDIETYNKVFNELCDPKGTFCKIYFYVDSNSAPVGDLGLIASASFPEEAAFYSRANGRGVTFKVMCDKIGSLPGVNCTKSTEQLAKELGIR